MLGDDAAAGGDSVPPVAERSGAEAGDCWFSGDGFMRENTRQSSVDVDRNSSTSIPRLYRQETIIQRIPEIIDGQMDIRK